MDEFPSTLLKSKQAGHAERKCGEFRASADLRAPALYLDNASEGVGQKMRYEVDSGQARL